jgi:HD-like signal output (HDOD) protein
MSVAHIDQELELAKTHGPVKDIVIPPCPDLLLELRRELDQKDPSPAEIARIASSDVAMAAALIRVANSPLYARSRGAATVGEAVAMLGVSQSVQILTGFLLRNTIRVNSPLIEHFWETSTRRALAMGFIARQLYGIDADVAHTCGLFCHVGIPILLQGLKGYSGTLAEAMARQDRSFTQTENAAHRTDHAVVGAIVAKTWRLPAVIALAVRLHHDFTIFSNAQLPMQARTLVAIALLAEHLVVTHEGVSALQEWEQHGASCLKFINVTQAEVDSWVDALHPLFESVAIA